MTQAQLRFFNTLSRTIEPFHPLQPGKVGLYCCGPTVYSYQHIGNMKTYIFEDVLVRTLRKAGFDVQHVMNITDVGHLVSDADDGEDKMLLAAKREGKRSEEIAQYYTDVFMEDCRKLNIVRPDVVCKATDHILDMIGLIERIQAREMAYVANGNVYFDVAKCPSYGKLAKLDLSKLQAGARIEVDQFKRSPFDFVLWFTKSKFENQELQWESPWGRGYPGWHIECSAMSIKYLGEQFDIHCGGIDHIPVHHVNEIAQSEGATGKPWVNLWMHSEFVVIGGEKMSKSTGKFIVLKDVEERGLDPLVYRLFCLSGHYRSQINYSWETLENTATSLSKLKTAVLALQGVERLESLGVAATGYRNEFLESMYNDLNTPKALAVLWAVLGDAKLAPGEKRTLIAEFDQVLGLGTESWRELSLPDDIIAMAKARDEARKQKNWAESDRIRNEITGKGYLVEDSSEGTKVRKR